MNHSTLRCIALPLLILLGMAITIPATAAPLQIDPSGRGQVLIYPYYTVRDGLTSLLTLHNGEADAKAVKLRLREPRNGRTALVLNLYLRPYERFGAALLEGDVGPELHIRGDACVIGATGSGAVHPLLSNDYTGGRRDHPVDADPALASTDRVRHGLIEAIDMGTLTAGEGPAELADEVIGQRTIAGTHVRNCAAVQAAWQGVWAGDPAQSIGLPSGGLSGSVQIVDVAGGALFAQQATAIDHFYRVASQPGRLHGPAVFGGWPYPWPHLGSADHGGFVEVRIPGVEQPVSVPIDPARPEDPDAVSLVLMTAGMENRVNVDPGLAGVADFVLTLPTRHYYTDVDGPTPARTLFPDRFAADGESCTAVMPLMADGEGYGFGLRRSDPTDIVCILPPPSAHPRVCSSVATFVAGAGDGPASGPLADPAPVSRIGIDGNPDRTLGINFDTSRVLPCNVPPPVPAPYMEIAGVRYTGLPAIGFVAQSFLNNDAQPGRVATYDSSLPHRRLPPLLP